MHSGLFKPFRCFIHCFSLLWSCLPSDLGIYGCLAVSVILAVDSHGDVVDEVRLVDLLSFSCAVSDCIHV